MVAEHAESAAPQPAAHLFDLFVIHAAADAEFVRGYLLPALNLPSSRVLLIDELPPGAVVASEIERGVLRSRFTVVVLSLAYLEARWAVFGELLASHLSVEDVRIIPLRLADCALPLRLQARVSLDFTDRARWEGETARLRGLLHTSAPATEPTFDPEPGRKAPGRQVFGMLGGATACALLASAWFLLRPDPQDQAPPLRDMVRFAAANVHLGVFAAGSRPPECSTLTASEDCAELEHSEKVGEVHVASFDLDRFEVTNEELAAWLNANVELWKLTSYGIVTTRHEPALPLLRTEKCGDGLTITPGNRAHVTAAVARRPVVCVSWYGANEYCRTQGKRLPLDTEWELAAKGAEGRPFPWGADLPRQDGVAFELRSGTAVHPRAVGDSPQDVSPEGVHDLGGNVAEWVEDGRGNPGEKTLRGGSFASVGPCHLLGSGCERILANKHQKDIGFRCARSVIDQPREAK